MITIRKLQTAVCLACLSAAAAHSQDTIDEIIVTADFREREARELPASISVLDGDEIDRLAVQHFEELVNVVPNFNWSGDGHRARYFQIRGVGELEQYEGAPNPSVGFLIDDIDFSGIGTIATLFDIERVEVLRGSQGTRYGANALGGLVYMRSAAPTTETTGRAEISVGGDEAIAGGIAIGGGIGANDSVAGRLSLHYHRSNGFRDNRYLGRDDTNGRKETTVRGRLHWSAGEHWHFEAAGLFADIDNGYDAFALDNGFTMLSDKPGKDAQRSAGASLRAEYSGWDAVTFTSITSAADSDIDFSFDADWGNENSWAPVTYDYVTISDRKRNTLSQEFRLAADDWLLGFYSLKLADDLDTRNEGEYFDPLFPDFPDNLFDPLASRYDASSVAVFGQYEHKLGERTRLSVGLRGERRTTDYVDSDGLRLGPSESLWGGELTLGHTHSGTLSSFISLSRGYKAGGFNLGNIPADQREFRDEAMLNLEAGVKAELLDGRLRVNASIFAGRRDDQQVRISLQQVTGDPASFGFQTRNAEEGRTAGLEADLQWLPNDSWLLYASVGMLETEFIRFDDASGLEGREHAHAPDFTLAAGTSYSHPNGVFARLDVSARDDFYFDVSHDERSRPYELVNARVGYEHNDWTLQAWVRNLFDETHAVRGFYFGNEPPDFPNTLYVRPGDPRQAGITYEKRF